MVIDGDLIQLENHGGWKSNNKVHWTSNNCCTVYYFKALTPGVYINNTALQNYKKLSTLKFLLFIYSFTSQIKNLASSQWPWTVNQDFSNPEVIVPLVSSQTAPRFEENKEKC